jgi:hypothetical protein
VGLERTGGFRDEDLRPGCEDGGRNGALPAIACYDLRTATVQFGDVFLDVTAPRVHNYPSTIVPLRTDRILFRGEARTVLRCRAARQRNL